MSENDNPFEAPKADLDEVIGIASGKREDVKRVAQYQKGILVCILIYFGAFLGQFAAPPEMKLVLAVGILVVMLAAAVFVFLLTMKLYGAGIGILFGILALVPCFGLLILLMVNSHATGMLKKNGIKVGLLGANLSEI